jgi:hypothetical protein
MPDFGTELRRRRMAAGLSLADLAAAVHFSKSHLSKVERGTKRPTQAMARGCDAALHAGGGLAELVAGGPSVPGPRPLVPVASGGGTWVLRMGEDGSGQFLATGPPEREFVDRMGMARWPAAAPLTGHSVESVQHVLGSLKDLARTASPALVLPTMISFSHALQATAARASGPTRQMLVRLGSRAAISASWMAQELGDDDNALWWIDQAVGMAEAGGDAEVPAYAPIRRALITLYQGDAASTIALAEQVEARSDASPRLRWQAAHRVAQGYALAGDSYRCLNALDRAWELADQRHDPAGPDEALGSTTPMETTSVITGWCFYDLGRTDAAIEVLDPVVARIPRTSPRAMVRFTLRQALAHASASNVDVACGLVNSILDDLVQIDSATVRTDLHTFARTIGRWPKHQAVTDLQPRLLAALRRV